MDIPSPQNDLLSYRVYRSWDGEEYEPIGTRPGWSCRYVDFVGGSGKKAFYKVSSIDVHHNESPRSEAATGATRPFDDEKLLDMVQEGCFRYYWEAANADSGMAVEILPGDPNLVATRRQRLWDHGARRCHRARVRHARLQASSECSRSCDSSSEPIDFTVPGRIFSMAARAA